MNLDRLTRLEDLTRRYAKHRPCGAGLGMLWGGLVYQFAAGLALGWVLRQVDNEGLTRALIHFQGRTPLFLQIAAIATPILVWLGVYLLQEWADRRFGAVEGQAHVALQFPRWFLPGFVICFEGLLLTFSVLNAYILFPGDEVHALDAWKVGGPIVIALLALVWGRAKQDQETRTLMMLVSLPSGFLLLSGRADLLVIAVTSCAYLALMFVVMVKGALRFGGFLAVSRKLAAIQPEAE